MKKEILDSVLYSTLCGEKIRKLLGIYSILEEKERKFLSLFSVSCPKCCGECCCHYVPYLSETEANVAAFLLIKEEREEEALALLNNGDINSPICPLYIEDREKHCFFYEGRSMVCRLFGGSVSLDKNGNPSYRDCKWKENKVVLDPTLLEEDKDSIAIMSNFGEYIEPEGDPIYISLPRAINQIKLLCSYFNDLPA